MNGLALELLLNVAFPVIVIAAIIALIFYSGSRKSKDRPHYDEMQISIRGKGYKIGFIISIIGLYAGSALLEISERFAGLVDPTVVMWIIGDIGLLAFVLYCIARNAFYSIGENRKAYIGLCIVLILCNGIPAYRRIRCAGLLDNGRITFPSISDLLMTVFFAIILVALIIKEITSRNEVGE